MPLNNKINKQNRIWDNFSSFIFKWTEKLSIIWFFKKIEQTDFPFGFKVGVKSPNVWRETKQRMIY